MARPRIISEPSRITVTFDKSDYESVCEIAAVEHETNSGVVRRAVREWLRLTSLSNLSSEGKLPGNKQNV